MKAIVGNPAEGDDFFDRESEQKKAWRKLEGSHLLMLAPRRIGKTSLIRRLCATARPQGFHAVECSFAKCGAEADCVRMLFDKLVAMQSISQKVLESLKVIKEVGLGGVKLDWTNPAQIDWRRLGEEIGRALGECEDDWLVCIDELPVFVVNLLKQEDGLRRVRAFLYWFRDLRQNHHRRVKWLLAGSIGLDTLAVRLNLTDAINDLEPFPLDAFSEDSAQRLLRSLAESYGMPLAEEVRQAIILRIGWPVPYYLQLMFSELRDAWEDSGVVPSVDAVGEVFEKLLHHNYRSYFDYWRQRLDDELGQPEAGYACLLLDAACRSAAGVGADTLRSVLFDRLHNQDVRDKTFVYLLDILQSDGYLVCRDDGKYAFRLEWLREYWRRRMGQ